jgi:hypothetical protein
MLIDTERHPMPRRRPSPPPALPPEAANGHSTGTGHELELEPLLNEHAVAKIIGCEVRSLRGARSRGVGDFASLPWVKCGVLVRYRPSELRRWLAARERGWQR